MAKKQKTPDPVILPDLALTSFSDMMTLMLTFFVLLFSMSEIRKERVVSAVNALRQQMSIMPAQKSPNQIFIPAQRLSQTQANVLRQGPPGKNPEVMTMVDDQRLRFIVGGKGKFARDQYDLQAEARNAIRDNVVPDLRGFQNRIEIRGHASSDEETDHWILGSQRAYATLRYLVDEQGIDESRFRIVSCGDREPYDPTDPSSNRLVEIVMTEYLVQGPGNR